MPHPPPDQEFTEFARARTPALLRSAYLLTGDQHLAQDLVQSALGRTLHAWKRVEHPEAFTRKTMYHLQVRWWRKRARTRQIDSLAAARASIPDTTENVARQVALQEALRRLTAKQRAVIVLRFYEDKGVTETAELLNCSIGNVKSQTAKALARLRTGLPTTEGFREWSMA